MHSLVYQDNSDHFCHFSGQLNISGQIQDINEISGISGQLGPLLTTKSTKEKRQAVHIFSTKLTRSQIQCHSKCECHKKQMNLFMVFSFLCRNTVTGCSVLTTHLTTATNDETCLKTKNTGITGKFTKIQEFTGRTKKYRKIQEIQER
mgnify:CR=1 FL=1